MSLRTIVIILLINRTLSKSAKNGASPVYEVINEQARGEERRVDTGPGQLPYGNPLAGNSLQNAKLHALNQQAMFNAERVRQHRAQLQRWTEAPIKADSYMRAYHESQENHQLALEQLQTNVRDRTVTTPRTQYRRQRPDLRRNKGPDPMKITADDAMEKNRNHRSHGSVEYRLQPNKMKAVYVTPGPTYDQGVTIKPNGNAGLTQSENVEESKLLTRAVASNTQHVYPRQFQQMLNYESANDIEALNVLLKKGPQTQLKELHALVQDKDKELETPIDLFFYLKDPSTSPHYPKAYAQVPNYANHYFPQKDHTPISENVDDVEDLNKYVKMPYNDYSQFENISNNEVHQYSANPLSLPEYQVDKPQAQPFEKPLTFHLEESTKDNLPPNMFNVVHHLSTGSAGSGAGASAYGDNLQYAANYEFGYHVRDHQSGNDFGHQEAKRNGKTNGQYHVLLPDGRMQNVRYFAGPEGFHADITYDLQT